MWFELSFALLFIPLSLPFPPIIAITSCISCEDGETLESVDEFKCVGSGVDKRVSVSKGGWLVRSRGLWRTGSVRRALCAEKKA